MKWKSAGNRTVACLLLDVHSSGTLCSCYSCMIQPDSRPASQLTDLSQRHPEKPPELSPDLTCGGIGRMMQIGVSTNMHVCFVVPQELKR